MESKKILAPLVVLLLGIGLVYVLTAVLIGGIFTPSNTNYYPFITDSFIHGIVNVPNPPGTYDLSLFQGKWYLNWGPSSVLYVLPFYLLWGVHASDVLFTLIAGVLNVFIFYCAAREFARYFEIKLTFFSQAFLLLNFAFASANFYLSMAGRIWHAEQVIAVFYLILSYFFLFRYLNKKNIFLLLGAVIFFNLAWTTRYALVFSFFILLCPLFMHFKSQSNSFLKRLLIIVVPTIAFCGIILFYNYLKFQDPFDTGLKHHLGAGRFEEIIRTHHFFSSSYVGYNSYYYFIRPPVFVTAPPYIKIDMEGTGMFFMYPSLLLLLPLFKKSFRTGKKITLYLATAGLVIVSSMALYLFYFTTGWTQAGLRYLLDITPLLFLTTILTINSIHKYLLAAILIIGIIMNLAGLASFYS